MLLIWDYVWVELVRFGCEMCFFFFFLFFFWKDDLCYLIERKRIPSTESLISGNHLRAGGFTVWQSEQTRRDGCYYFGILEEWLKEGYQSGMRWGLNFLITRLLQWFGSCCLKQIGAMMLAVSRCIIVGFGSIVEKRRGMRGDVLWAQALYIWREKDLKWLTHERRAIWAIEIRWYQNL